MSLVDEMAAGHGHVHAAGVRSPNRSPRVGTSLLAIASITR